MNNSDNILDLEKSFELNLEKANILAIPQMDTKLSVDRSGSMEKEFKNGWVDKAINLFLVAALKFDSDGKLEMGFFNHQYKRTADASAEDFDISYTQKYRISADGGTQFADAVRQMANTPPVGSRLRQIFGGGSAKAKPAYHGLITDGDASDFYSFEDEVIKMDPRNFLQIIAIGDEVSLQLFAKIKEFKNVSLIHILDPYKLNHADFYELICHDKLANWISTL